MITQLARWGYRGARGAGRFYTGTYAPAFFRTAYSGLKYGYKGIQQASAKVPWRWKGRIAGAGLGVAAIMAGSKAMELTQRAAQAKEADIMSRMVLRAQSGPFGPMARSYGMHSNTGHTAGLTLASHYARNHNKNFGVLGLKFL